VSGSFDCGSETVTLSFSSPSPYPVTGSGTGMMMATGGFGGSKGWRLPSIYELNTLVEPGYPNCSGAPCTTVPGETVSSGYWSSSTIRNDPVLAWLVSFEIGYVDTGGKPVGGYVRAVRGGS